MATARTKASNPRAAQRAAKSARCAMRVQLGHRLKHIPTSGPYDVCLTATQKRALFGASEPGKALGCGTFACVWPGAHMDRVVKLTRDRDDAEGLKASQGLSRVVKTYAIRTLPNAGRDLRTKRPIHVYAIVAERLRPLTKAEERRVAKPLERARIAMLERASKFRGRASSFQPPQGAEREKVLRAVCRKTPGAGCERFVGSFMDGWAEMFQRGILWQDAHPGNIAMDGKRWKAIDLGFSGTKKRSDIPALNGVWRRRRRR